MRSSSVRLGAQQAEATGRGWCVCVCVCACVCAGCGEEIGPPARLVVGEGGEGGMGGGGRKLGGEMRPSKKRLNQFGCFERDDEGGWGGPPGGLFSFWLGGGGIIFIFHFFLVPPPFDLNFSSFPFCFPFEQAVRGTVIKAIPNVSVVWWVRFLKILCVCVWGGCFFDCPPPHFWFSFLFFFLLLLHTELKD